jgi:LPS export ABC transporter protein LptC
MPMTSQYLSKKTTILGFSFILACILCLSCSNEKQEIKRVLPKKNLKVEIAEDVVILYSDSARVKVRITSPLLKRYELRGEKYDEFPEGLQVEFLNKRKNTVSWLEADYAVRKELDNKVYVERNVKLYNKKNDQLLTDELVWDEENEALYTIKPVKIAQPSIGDTSFGFGFRADQEFTKFEIQRKFSAIRNIDELSKSFDNK